MEAVLEYIDKNQDNVLKTLSEFIVIPSIAAQKIGIEESAEFVAMQLEEAGLQSEIHSTGGAPVVTGHLDVGAERTLLFYDHYDVQPAEPLDLWDSPPFEADIRNGRIYGRGTSDNKGNTISRIFTLKAFKETNTDPPVNIKFCIEGEEEIASINLPDFVRKNKDFLKADAGVWEFGGEGYDGRQQAWLGLKGDLYIQLEIQCLNRDVHSSQATHLPSAPDQLIQALASLKDRDGRVQIDGFYDDIKPLDDKELTALEKIELHENDIKENFQLEQLLHGLSGDELKQVYYNSPTCTISGLTSGYQGEGSMTILPAKASAKLDFRLVENQDPEKILENLKKHFSKLGYDKIHIPWYEAYPAAKTPIDHPFVEVVRKANEAVFGDLVVHPTSPASGPLFLFKDLVPMVAIGCADVEARQHAPNESIALKNLFLDMKRFVHLFYELSKWVKL